MFENKDPVIKLFGMKIPFPTVLEVADEQNKNQNETSTYQSEKDKSLKKPTKILPCPRCDSMETKFCYYNNYNVNQPRHFCKACQRYWTSGGTMRSVPIGAGRRKNKNNNSSSSLHYRHVAISETNSPLFSFSIGDNQKVSNDRFVNPKLVARTENNVDDCFNNDQSIGESRTRANETNGLDCFQGVSWPYTWNPVLYPVCPYWNIPMLSSPVHSSHKTTLGKHFRDENETKQKDGSVLVPKTLRIDDPKEAAKSSIWTTLGIKNEVMFKGFDSKKEIKINKEETESCVVACANPAAFSRSVNFHERT